MCCSLAASIPLSKPVRRAAFPIDIGRPWHHRQGKARERLEVRGTLSLTGVWERGLDTGEQTSREEVQHARKLDTHRTPPKIPTDPRGTDGKFPLLLEEGTKFN
jgi:hypothetical protein